MTDIAIAHKAYDCYGGGEIVAEELARTFDAPLYAGHRVTDRAADDVDIRTLAPDAWTHRLMDRPGAVRGVGHLIHWRDYSDALRKFDVVILSGDEPAVYVPPDDQTVIRYCHSPPRFQYDRYDEVDGLIGRTYQHLQRRLYDGTARRPDLFIANSELIARRIQRYWAVDDDRISVVYPPVETRELGPDVADTSSYHLALSRLDEAKEMGRIVRVYNGRSEQLVVAGDGPERNRLESMAADNVEIVGYVSEERKRELLAGAEAFVYSARNEDFGMAPVEAMAAGTPVIGVADGYTRHQIHDGDNGILFERGELSAAVDRFQREGVEWTDREIALFAAQNFSTAQFRRGVREAVDEARQRARVTVDHEVPAEKIDAALEQATATDGGVERDRC